jgi:hypothetical protein
VWVGEGGSVRCNARIEWVPGERLGRHWVLVPGERVSCSPRAMPRAMPFSPLALPLGGLSLGSAVASTFWGGG